MGNFLPYSRHFMCKFSIKATQCEIVLHPFTLSYFDFQLSRKLHDVKLSCMHYERVNLPFHNFILD